MAIRPALHRVLQQLLTISGLLHNLLLCAVASISLRALHFCCQEPICFSRLCTEGYCPPLLPCWAAPLSLEAVFQTHSQSALASSAGTLVPPEHLILIVRHWGVRERLSDVKSCLHHTVFHARHGGCTVRTLRDRPLHSNRHISR